MVLPVSVRRANLADLETIVELNEALARESEGLELDRAVLARGVRRVLEDESVGRYYIATAASDDGDVIGQTMVTFEWSDWRDGMIWWIQSVYVREAARGAGVLAAIASRIEADARAAGARALRLYVVGSNTRARRAYEKIGLDATEYVVHERDWSGATRPTRS